MLLKNLIVILSLTFASLASTEIKSDLLSEVNVTQATLSNGIRVYLKPIVSENDEVVIRLTAAGGYASLPPSQIASGALASEVAAESGIGEMTANRFSVYLDKNFIEFNSEILAFSRVVEGNTDATQIPILLSVIKSFFTEQRFTKEAFDAVMKDQRTKITEFLGRSRQNPESAYYNMNSEGYPYLQPLTLEDLDKADFETMRDFFFASFKNPADFVCVVTGRFEVAPVLAKLEEVLGTLPVKPEPRSFKTLTFPTFPKGTTIRHYPGRGKGDSLARLTIPFQKPFTAQNFTPLQAVAPLMKAHLKPLLEEKYGSRLAVNVSYDYPFAPSVDTVWLVVFFHGPTKDIIEINDFIVKEINELVTKGPAIEELHKAWEKVIHNNTHTAKENSYWSTMITEFVLRGWDIRAISRIDAAQITGEKMKEILKDYIPIDNYTLIYTQ